MSESRHRWTFLTNHARVLLLLGGEPDLRLRDLADRSGITERAVQGIVHDLAEAGYVRVRRDGRRNRYTVAPHRPFRHPAEAAHAVGELLDLFGRGDDQAGPAASSPAGSTPAGRARSSTRASAAATAAQTAAPASVAWT